MQPTDILYPVFVLVGLTFFLQLWMGRERLSAIERGEVKSGDIALGQRAWPARATRVANAYHNQFELPVLFYALVAYALIMSRVDLALIILAWVFVALRLWHAQIHTTHNTVRQRFMVFVSGSAALLIMWLYFALSFIVTRIVV